MECFTASEGDHALQLIREHAPDAAVLDVIMPQLGWLRSTRRGAQRFRRAQPARAPVKRHAAGGGYRPCFRARRQRLNVTKPFSPVEVVARLKRLVTERGVTRKERIGRNLVYLQATGRGP